MSARITSVLCATWMLAACAGFGNPPQVDWTAPSARAARLLAPVSRSRPSFRAALDGHIVANAFTIGADVVLDARWQAGALGPLVRVDGTTGEARWRLPRDATSWSTLGHDDHTLLALAGSNRGTTLLRIDLDSGAVLARRDAGAEALGLIVDDAVILLEPTSATVTRYEGADLTPSWSIAADGARGLKLAAGRLYVLGPTITVVEPRRGAKLGELALGNDAHDLLLGFPSETGLIVWQVTAEASSVSLLGPDAQPKWPAPVRGDFVDAAHGVVVVQRGEELVTLAARDGKELWRFDYVNGSSGSTTFARGADGRPLLLVSEQDRVTALGLVRGDVRFVAMAAADERRERHADLLWQNDDGLVMWDTARHVTGLEPDGRVRYRLRVRSQEHQTVEGRRTPPGTSNVHLALRKSVAIQQRLDNERGAYLVRPLSWDIGEGLLVVRKRDGAFQELVTGPAERYADDWRPSSLAVVVARSDGSALVLGVGLGLDPSAWPPAYVGAGPSLVPRALFGFAVDALAPADAYETTSLVPDGAFRE